MLFPADPALLDRAREQLRAHGYALLSAAFDPRALTAEVDLAIADGCQVAFRFEGAGVAVSGRYVPMTCERTPVSLSLLVGGAAAAARVLGRAVVPFRAKGTVYDRRTDWHVDTDLAVPGVSVLAYLDPLDAHTGALRVVPGSHLAGWIPRGPDPDPDAVALPTRPGDLILLDEHTRHGSEGGSSRRQWRADYVALPETPAEDAVLRAYVGATFSPGWDGGYDVDHYPSFGRPLLQALDPAARAMLEQSGALAAAAREEAYVRAKRSR